MRAYRQIRRDDACHYGGETAPIGEDSADDVGAGEIDVAFGDRDRLHILVRHEPELSSSVFVGAQHATIEVQTPPVDAVVEARDSALRGRVEGACSIA